MSTFGFSVSRICFWWSWVKMKRHVVAAAPLWRDSPNSWQIFDFTSEAFPAGAVHRLSADAADSHAENIRCVAENVIVCVFKKAVQQIVTSRSRKSLLALSDVLNVSHSGPCIDSVLLHSASWSSLKAEDWAGGYNWGLIITFHTNWEFSRDLKSFYFAPFTERGGDVIAGRGFAQIHQGQSE